MKDRVEKWLQKDYRSTFFERIELLMKSEPLYRDLSYPERYGMTLKYILENMTVFIQEGEQLIGSILEIIPSEKQKRFVDELYASWWNAEDEDIQKRIFWFYSDSWLKCRPDWFYSFGHMALDWPTLLEVGLGGMKEKAQAQLKRPEIASSPESISFIKGAIYCYEALSVFIKRYEVLAKCEMPSIAHSLGHIAESGARNLFEALQLIWLVVLPVMKVCGCGVLNYSRMDQYLLAYYEKDIQEGTLTREQALNLIEEFFYKNNEVMVPVDHMSLDSTKTTYTMEATFDDPNYLTIAGRKADGSSGVNELSHIMVEAQHRLGQRNPFMVLRYHADIDEAFWLKACDAIRDNATIVIYNDETMIPALKAMNVSEPEVYDYGFFGCNDPNIPAQEGGLREIWFNLARPLELALNRGDYPMEPFNVESAKECQFSLRDRMVGMMRGPYYGIQTDDLNLITSMDVFLKQYKKQVEFMIRQYREGLENDMKIEAEYNRNGFRIEDCFLKGTIENAVTWNNGGTKYHKIIAQGSGIATVIDSLYVLDKLVFLDKEMSLQDFAKLLASDFEGNEILAVRLQKKFNKFGNDKADVDKYAKIAVDIFVDAVMEANSQQYLYDLWPALSTDRDFALMGSFVGATPDGRRHRAPISENQSPTVGADINGLTSLLNSVAKIPFDRITGGPLNIRIHPSAVQGEAGLYALAELFKTYMQKGGMQLQVNVVSKETLLEAQKNPEKYRGLCVRVTGYSAYFVQMGKEAQDELISRTELA